MQEGPHLSTSSPTLIIVISINYFIIILVDVNYLSVVFICFSLMATDGERLFVCVLAIYVSPAEKHLFKVSAHVLIGVFVFLSLTLQQTF